MKTVLQRVKSASVSVDGKLISSIGKGLLVFAGVAKEDTEDEVKSMANKVLRAKLWEDEEDRKWKRNVQDIDGDVLCVSQFTLLASTKKPSPDFRRSAPPGPAKELYDKFFSTLQTTYKADKIKDGVFQAMMDVALVNDGPVGVDYSCEDGVVTILIETNPPSMENPTGLDLPEDATVHAKINKKFTLPASLLE